MAQNVNGLVYKPTSDNADYVAHVACDSTVDTDWRISPVGSIDGNPSNINPDYIIIDNIANNGGVNAAWGPYAWFVPPYSRKMFRLPVQSNLVEIVLTVGTVNVYFVENPNFAPDDANLLAIQLASQGAAVFPFVVYTANTNQAKSDATKSVALVPTVTLIQYLLLQIAPNVTNGWIEFVYNNGTKVAQLVPFAGDTLNALFNNATPFNLFPGEMGILSSDGTQWFFRVLGQRRPIIVSTIASTTQTPNDINKRMIFNSGAALAYDLLTAGDFENGDTIKIKNVGAGRLSVVPTGAEKIANLFTNAAPLLLSTNDEVELFIDDQGDWNVSGEITFTSPQVNWGSALTGNIAHGLGVKPYFLEPWLICLNAELGYAQNDEFLKGNTQSASATAGAPDYMGSDAININYTFTQRATLRLAQKATGVDSDVTIGGGHATNFAAFFKAKAKL